SPCHPVSRRGTSSPSPGRAPLGPGETLGAPGGPPSGETLAGAEAVTEGLSQRGSFTPSARGPADDDHTPPDHAAPPADAPGPAARRPQPAHPGALPPGRPTARRPPPPPARPAHRAAGPRLLPPPQERPEVRPRLARDRLQRHQVLLLPH